MDVNEQVFIDLLHAFVNKTEPVVNSKVEWNQLFNLSTHHSVGGIIGYMVSQLPVEQRPDDVLMNTINESMCSTLFLFTKRAYAMQQLMKHFSEANIPCLLMKGYVICRYYPVPELRTYGDIDFLIKPEDRERAHSLMLALGYQLFKSGSDVWSYKNELEYYEIHTHILSDINHLNDKLVAYFDDVWNHIVPYDENCIFQLNPDFHFIYLFLHMSKHFSYNGAGIRMFLDLALFVKNNAELDQNYIIDELKKLGLYQFACSVSDLCYRWFGVKMPIAFEGALDDTTYNELSHYILSGGVFGQVGRDLGMPVLRMEYCKGTTSNKTARYRSMWNYYFPSYINMKQAYPFLEGKPYLLPVGWIVRILKNIGTGRLNKVREQMKRINLSDAEQARNQSKLFRSIGLASVFGNKTEIHRK